MISVAARSHSAGLCHGWIIKQYSDMIGYSKQNNRSMQGMVVMSDDF